MRIISVYVGSSALAGALVGALVGLVSVALQSVFTFAAIAVAVGLMLTVFALLELTPGFEFLIPQRHAQTRKMGSVVSAERWASRTGMTLGTGVLTRIGFAVWFVLLAVPLLAGSVAVAVIGFALYGAARTILGLFMFPFVTFPSRLFPTWFPAIPAQHRVSALATLAVAVPVLVAAALM